MPFFSKGEEEEEEEEKSPQIPSLSREGEVGREGGDTPTNYQAIIYLGKEERKEEEEEKTSFEKFFEGTSLNRMGGRRGGGRRDSL